MEQDCTDLKTQYGIACYVSPEMIMNMNYDYKRDDM